MECMQTSFTTTKLIFFLLSLPSRDHNELVEPRIMAPLAPAFLMELEVDKALPNVMHGVSFIHL